jgi:hypothetical protein
MRLRRIPAGPSAKAIQAAYAEEFRKLKEKHAQELQKLKEEHALELATAKAGSAQQLKDAKSVLPSEPLAEDSRRVQQEHPDVLDIAGVRESLSAIGRKARETSQRLDDLYGESLVGKDNKRSNYTTMFKSELEQHIESERKVDEEREKLSAARDKSLKREQARTKRYQDLVATLKSRKAEQFAAAVESRAKGKEAVRHDAQPRHTEQPATATVSQAKGKEAVRNYEQPMHQQEKQPASDVAEQMLNWRDELDKMPPSRAEEESKGLRLSAAGNSAGTSPWHEDPGTGRAPQDPLASSALQNMHDASQDDQ